MKITYSLWFWIELLLLGIIFFFVFKSKLFYAQTKKQVKFISEDDLRENIRRKKQVLDTREKDDLTFDYIKGVRNVTMADFMQKNVSINNSQPVYIIDWTEKQELKKANKIRKLGATEIFILKDGMAGVKGKTTGRFEKIDAIKLSKEELEEASV